MFNTGRFHRQIFKAQPRKAPLSQTNWRHEHASFQWKYTGFLLAAIFGAVTLFLGSASYQLHNNYEIFKKLAFDTNPELVQHLEREMTEFNLFLVATLASVFAFCLVLGLRMTGNVLRPLIRMENHMKKITRGDWASPDYRFRFDDDLAEFQDTYAYLYRSLRAHTESELHLLEKLSVDTKNRETVAIWRSLIKQKRAQLSMPVDFQFSDSDVKIAPSAESRRAS